MRMEENGGGALRNNNEGRGGRKQVEAGGGRNKKTEVAEDTCDTGIINFSPTFPVAGRY